MSNDKNIPVYLFTGFLESGKTKFIQETLEDKRFCNGEKTLLLVCEEGEEEYAPEQFASDTVKIRVIEDDAFRYAREVLPGEKCDFVFADIWRDVSDGLPCYLRFRALEHLTPHTVWRYWIEPSMLSHLRYTVFSFLEDAMEGKGELPFSAGQRSVSPDDLKTWLSDDFLRKLAGTDLMK